MNEAAKALDSLGLHDRMVTGDVHKYGFQWEITRVPGGWIYTSEAGRNTNSVFVPYHNEFFLAF